MAKLLFLVFLCFQFSRPEELTGFEKLENKLHNDEVAFPKVTLNSEPLDGADEDQWYKGESKNSDEDQWYKGESKNSDEEWTADDEKWLQNIQNLLAESDEDYDDDSEKLVQLINEIEEWVEKTHPEKSHYQWLVEIGQWLEVDNDDWDLSDYPDYVQKEGGIDVEVDKNKDLYYSWLYKMRLRSSKSKEKRSLKRFSSV